MLILSRRINETVIINDSIKVHVLGVQGHQVKLGFEAGKDVEIHRQEIFDRIQEERKKKVIVFPQKKIHCTA